MYSFPITVRPAKEGGFIVSFVDIPEAITQAETKAEALLMAREALETALDFYFDDGQTVPTPSLPKRGQQTVELTASVTAKVILLNEMLTQKVRPVELARRLKTTPQEVNRLTNIRHTSRIDGIEAALQAMGKTLEMRAV